MGGDTRLHSVKRLEQIDAQFYTEIDLALQESGIYLPAIDSANRRVCSLIVERSLEEAKTLINAISFAAYPAFKKLRYSSYKCRDLL